MIHTRKIKHVMWDWNGTLMDDGDLNVEIINPILARFGIPPLTLERYRNMIDFPVKVFYDRLGIDPGLMTYEQFAREFFKVYDERRFECGLYSHVSETLEAFKLEGLTQSILSAHQEASLRELLKFYELEHYFQDVTAAKDQAGDSKVKMGVAKIDRLGLQGHNVLMIGDTAHDYEVAQAMGADCILLSHGYHSMERLQACDVPIMHSMNELRQTVLAKLSAN